MNSHRDELDAYAEATRPTAAQDARLEARLRAPAPPPGRARWGFAIPIALGLATVLLGGLIRARAPVPVDAALSGVGAWELGETVALDFDGAGSANGDSRDVAIDWRSGRLSVEVTPGAGVHLAVVTREARVQVVGTGFDVLRDAFGTDVNVRHGVVTVQCSDATTPGAAEQRLEAGGSTLCLPVSPAALLGRAYAQKERGDAPTAVLETLARARVGAAGNVAAEIALLEAVQLDASGQPEAALAVTEAALAAEPGVRRVDLLRLATRLAVAAGGCARAAAHVAALTALSEPTPCPELP